MWEEYKNPKQMTLKEFKQAWAKAIKKFKPNRIGGFEMDELSKMPVRLYLSHPIRGKMLEGLSKEEQEEVMAENCAQTKYFANRIRDLNLPIELYVPAEHEDFVQIAYREGMITEAQILIVDCKIIDDCRGVIYYDPQYSFSSGMDVERLHQERTNKPGITFHFAGPTMKEDLNSWLHAHFFRTR